MENELILHVDILMHLNFHRLIKLFGKIRLLYKSFINNPFPLAFLSKFYIRSCEDRREYTYTEYIPERRSGRDRRKSKNGKSSFWSSMSAQYKKD
jgi:hypothetical protein